jgi:hypothetical protein
MMKAMYASAYNRVGEARLQKIINTMRERLEAKVAHGHVDRVCLDTLAVD